MNIGLLIKGFSIPLAPTGLVVSNKAQTILTLSWTASVGNAPITGYKVYKNGALYTDAGNVLFINITGQVAEASNTWTVQAYNAAGNHSLYSDGLVVVQTPNVWSVLLNSPGDASESLACFNTHNSVFYMNNAVLTSASRIYTTAAATTLHNGGGNYYSDGSYSFQISSVGVMSAITICTF